MYIYHYPNAKLSILRASSTQQPRNPFFIAKAVIFCEIGGNNCVVLWSYWRVLGVWRQSIESVNILYVEDSKRIFFLCFYFKFRTTDQLLRNHKLQLKLLIKRESVIVTFSFELFSNLMYAWNIYDCRKNPCRRFW